ncbi:hypothetical protein QWY93_08165 [Echinicola jeungdonensis]|uniref:Beta-carotene 15,15'-monooxygenase n=1 Tax=Echinicola jeungdonensis TaxID=709343 RepID=A0ABV5J6K2_9BACT|nr:hypothetical protein [Echinicola jeungdonensis]MDN3669300.1 hypothetical protein [Echinicola jeungdonensis]
MDQQKYIEDLREIREIMNRSSRFISLSGLSGISAGIFALIGAYVAYKTVYAPQGELNYNSILFSSESILKLILIGAITLVCATGAAILFTKRTAEKKQQKLWDHQTKRLLVNLAIPLLSGGIFCLMLILNGFLGLIAPLTLIFYGLSLVNASKYTLSEVRSLGLAEIVLGLLSAYFIGFGLLFWAIGFGVLHIIYGVVMQLKYKS